MIIVGFLTWKKGLRQQRQKQAEVARPLDFNLSRQFIFSTAKVTKLIVKQRGQTSTLTRSAKDNRWAQFPQREKVVIDLLHFASRLHHHKIIDPSATVSPQGTDKETVVDSDENPAIDRSLLKGFDQTLEIFVDDESIGQIAWSQNQVLWERGSYAGMGTDLTEAQKLLLNQNWAENNQSGVVWICEEKIKFIKTKNLHFEMNNYQWQIKAQKKTKQGVLNALLGSVSKDGKGIENNEKGIQVNVKANGETNSPRLLLGTQIENWLSRFCGIKIEGVFADENSFEMVDQLVLRGDSKNALTIDVLGPKELVDTLRLGQEQMGPMEKQTSSDQKQFLFRLKNKKETLLFSSMALMQGLKELAQIH